MNLDDIRNWYTVQKAIAEGVGHENKGVHHVGAHISLLDGAKVGERVKLIEEVHRAYMKQFFGADIDEAPIAIQHRDELIAIIRGMQARLDADEAALGRVRGVLADWTRPAGLSGTSDRVMICKDLQEALGEFKEGGNG
jgi:hypothetical protein